jgi:hypothetical protein
MPLSTKYYSDSGKRLQFISVNSLTPVKEMYVIISDLYIRGLTSIKTICWLCEVFPVEKKIELEG